MDQLARHVSMRQFEYVPDQHVVVKLSSVVRLESALDQLVKLGDVEPALGKPVEDACVVPGTKYESGVLVLSCVK